MRITVSHGGATALVMLGDPAMHKLMPTESLKAGDCAVLAEADEPEKDNAIFFLRPKFGCVDHLTTLAECRIVAATVTSEKVVSDRLLRSMLGDGRFRFRLSGLWLPTGNRMSVMEMAAA
jgi:hypothetical protein